MVEGLSILIPVYNEERFLVENCMRLLRILRPRFQFEIIIGNNGSDDGTERICSRLAEEQTEIRFFSLDRKGIVGRIFRNAVRMARHEKLLSLDADLTIDLGFIDQAYRLLDGHDMVIGSKKAGIESRNWTRRLGSDLYIKFVKSLMGIEYSDYSIGAKGYRRSVIMPHLDRLEAKTAYVLTLTYLLKREGRRIVQVPVDCSDRRGSRFNLFREGVYRFSHLFWLWGIKRLRFS